MRRARRAGGALLAGMLLLLAPPARAATIEGKVVHPQRSDAVAGLEVRALGLDEQGKHVKRRVRTDGTGRFRMSDLPRPAAYLLSTTYGGIPFSGGSVVFRKEDPDQARHVTLRVYDRTTDSSQLTVKQIRFVVEREAGAFQMSEEVTLQNSGQEVILRDEAQGPAVRVGLPRGRGEVRTPFGGLEEGQKVKGEALEIYGPIYPGERESQLLMDLAGDGADLDLELGFPTPVEQVELYIKDYGIDVSAAPLHAARAARSSDVIYQRFVGFDLPAGTRVPVRVRALPPRTLAPGWAQALLMAVVGLGFMVYVVRPSARSAGEPVGEAPGDEEREALRAALEDLQDDFETGKLSAEDHARLRHGLKQEAVRRLAEAAGAAEVPAGAAEVPAGAAEVPAGAAEVPAGAAEVPAGAAGGERCACGHEVRPGDRFCSTCGRRL